MNIWSKNFIFMALLTGIAIHGSEAERKQDAANGALIAAVENGSLEKVTALLKTHANPDEIINKNDVLIKAIGNIPIVALLLEAKADPNKIVDRNTFFSRTPLSISFGLMLLCGSDDEYAIIRHNVLQCTKLLLDHKANVNALSSLHVPLICDAAHRNLPSLVTVYLKYDADTELADADGRAFRDHADDKPEILQIYKEHVDKVRTEISDASKFSAPLTQLCVSYLYLPEHEYRNQRAEVIGATIPQLTNAQDFREHETNLTARIAEYV